MTRPLKIRLMLFALAIFTLAIAIGWVAYAGWAETEQLRERFGTEQLRSFAIADHIQSSILELNHSLTRFELQGATNDLQKFEHSTSELNSWIAEQKPQLSSQREKELLTEIRQAFDTYLFAATNRSLAVPEGSDKKLRRLEQTSDASLQIIDSGRKLADAHREVLQQFLLTSQDALTRLQSLRTILLILLIASLVWLFVTIYREMIAPLQRKLIESHAIIERQEKLASLGVLAAGVAHEIRNPLTAIKARLFTLRKGLTNNIAALEDSTVISSEINRLEQIVKDVLDFARPSDPKLRPLTAEPLLGDVADFLRPVYDKQSIRILVDWCTAAPFQGDPEQLRQVLINLIRNAAESICSSGEITLRARSTRAKLSGQSTWVVILEVHDTGKGIAPDVQKRLFDPFFSTKEGGTGLGLSIAARILEKHGGALEFQTLVDRGTVFGIVLPALDHE